MSQKLEEMLKSMHSHKGVLGTILLDGDGLPIKSTLNNQLTVLYSKLMVRLSDKARSVVRDLDPSNDLTFFRVQSNKREIMVAPDKDFTLIVIQLIEN